MQTVEKWKIFELSVKGICDGNPFMDAFVTGMFSNGDHQVKVDGFYNGDDTYVVRFMPEYEGVYTYHISGNVFTEIITGSFEVTPAKGNNHGPVRVIDQCHLGYEDGTPYYSIGTTCYAWVHQTMELQEETLHTLKNSPFNKIRFCIYPKHYEFNRKEPLTYPYVHGNSEGLDESLVIEEREHRIDFPGLVHPEYEFNFNYYVLNVEHFKRLDMRIKQLQDLGIEADIILMHPYDKWGMNFMKAECCDLYLRYVVARYSAYCNVWWSLANEYDLIGTKKLEDWERYASIIVEKDPYNHLRSIHNCNAMYDHTKPWVTHCSMQRQDFYKTTELTTEYLEKYKKPIVWDEIVYEGNIHLGWGNIPAKELVRRFWEAFMRGGHAGHGETFVDENEILWWSHGGKLKGESAPRLQFLWDVFKEIPGRYVKNSCGMFDEVKCITEYEEVIESVLEMKTNDYQLEYFGITQPSYRVLFLPEDQKYQVDIIDTWNMTITNAGIFSGETKLPLPQKQYIAIRIRLVGKYA